MVNPEEKKSNKSTSGGKNDRRVFSPKLDFFFILILTSLMTCSCDNNLTEEWTWFHDDNNMIKITWIIECFASKNTFYNFIDKEKNATNIEAIDMRN